MAFPYTDDIMFGSSLAFSTALSEYPLVISLFSLLSLHLTFCFHIARIATFC